MQKKKNTLAWPIILGHPVYRFYMMNAQLRFWVKCYPVTRMWCREFSWHVDDLIGIILRANRISDHFAYIKSTCAWFTSAALHLYLIFDLPAVCEIIIDLCTSFGWMRLAVFAVRCEERITAWTLTFICRNIHRREFVRFWH